MEAEATSQSIFFASFCLKIGHRPSQKPWWETGRGFKVKGDPRASGTETRSWARWAVVSPGLQKILGSEAPPTTGQRCCPGGGGKWKWKVAPPAQRRVFHRCDAEDSILGSGIQAHTPGVPARQRPCAQFARKGNSLQANLVPLSAASSLHVTPPRSWPRSQQLQTPAVGRAGFSL